MPQQFITGNELSKTIELSGNNTFGVSSSNTITINGTTINCPNNLNFDSDTLFIDSSNNRVILGANSSIGTSSARLQILQPTVSGFSVGTSTTPSSGTSFAGWDGWAYDGTNYFAAATINFRADENWSSTNHGSVIQFRTTTSGIGGSLSEKMRIDSSGNLGLGVTPSAWGSSGNLDLRATSSIVTQGDNLQIGTNWYYNSGYKYKTSDFATSYDHANGQHKWFTAPSGTAGNPITFTQAMTLDASGNLGIGTSSPTTTAEVSGDITMSYLAGVNYAPLGSLLFRNTASQAATNPVRASIGAFRQQSAWGAYLSFFTSTGTDSTVERLRIDSSGNLGLGVTPSAWGNGHRALDIGVNSYVSGSTSLTLENNAYYNGTNNIYKNSAAATQYQQTNTGTHTWSTAPSGTAGNAISFTQAMTLDSSGNLGIGTSSPERKLHLYSSGTCFKLEGSSTNVYFQLACNGQTNAQSGYIGYNSTSDLIFLTSDAEKMRISSSGRLCIGTTSSTHLLNVHTNATFLLNGAQTNIEDGGSVGWSGNALIRRTSGSGYLILMNGTTGGVALTGGGTSWSSISDERFKTDLIPIDNAIRKISNVRAVTGRFKTDDINVSRSFIIAQDIQKVFPEAVDSTNPDKLCVSYTDTIPLLIAAIKELSQKIELLESTNQSLLERIIQLEAK